ncbi:CoA ester lyase [Pseudonocardia nematodicida]|uniref:CoA ester lyase n=1 Tax=Pseudonocardia nematodicida TaxID=1206997 RepID=A0ABV1KHP9_9PSEU
MSTIPERRARIGAARALLFAPANEARKVRRLPDFGADAVVLDLEDAVADSEAEAARAGVASALATPAYRDAAAVRCVRINSWSSGLGPVDLRGLPVALLDAVVVPKVETAAELVEIDRALAGAEREAGLEPGAVGLICLVETARGITGLPGICADLPARVARLVFGSGDFTAELGVTWRPMSPATVTARDLVVLHSRAAGLPPPFDGPYLDIHDADGLRRDCEDSLAHGLTGRVCVYPAQVAVAQGVYADDADLDHARRLVDAFEKALGEGSASIQFDGVFVDYPIYEQARRKVARAS